MNKNALKTFAVNARKNLIAAVKNRAYEYGIDATGFGERKATVINGRPLSSTEVEQRAKLVAEIEANGYEQVMEEAAYTWFNRFIALRYMEVNRYLPSRIRVFTNEAGEFDPEILKRVDELDFIGEQEQQKVYDFIENSDRDGLFKFLIIAQCNALHTLLPCMFEPLSDYTELLFPANLLLENSVLADMVNTIPEEDWYDQVQIIGWLYQYYNSEFKDETYAELKKKAKLTKEKIPAVTQLFTPDWIVRYMVENSLGRLWYEGHPDEAMKSAWKYYLDEAEQEAEVQTQLDAIKAEYAGIKPEQIKVMDPSMGSGHVLVYAFDVLMQIYLSQGWREREAAKSIVENNLYGIDIDKRAYQLAYFAVMMKARSYSRNILKEDVTDHLCVIRESNHFDYDCLDLFGKNSTIAKRLVEELIDAKEYGSILMLKTPFAHMQLLQKQLAEIENTEYENYLDYAHKEILIDSFKPLLKQAILLADKYDAVITNPPYMTPTPKQKPYVEKNYPDSKADLFAVFIEKCQSMTNNNRFYAMITMQSWMFLSSFEKLRVKMMHVDTINMAHLGARAFDEIGGEVVQTTAFARRKSNLPNYKGVYCLLIEPKSEQGKCDMFFEGINRYCARQSNFKKIPGSPIAYWVSEQLLKVFEQKKIGDYAYPKQGLATGDNNRFLRYWFEVCFSNVFFNCTSHHESTSSDIRWYPCNKGGSFRRWYGNNDYVVDWENDGNRIKNFFGENGKLRSRPQNIDFYFKKGITWSTLSSGGLSMRFSPEGFLFETKGSVCFMKNNNNLLYLLGLVNSKIVDQVLFVLSPTLDYHEGPMSKVPVIISNEKHDYVDVKVKENIILSKKDWDSFETSWDFKKHPLI